MEYRSEGIDDEDLPDTPFALWTRWVADAQAVGASGFESPESLAMAFATVDPDGCPNVRTVLVRFLDERGPGFVTDTTSTKAMELQGNPQVAGSVGWPSLFRAVRFRGVAEQLEPGPLAAYFTARPWGSRISALASRQSAVTGTRADLDALFERYAARYPDTGSPDDVPVPQSWGGYRIRSWQVEFWAGRHSRLHDRIVYEIDWPKAEQAGDVESATSEPATAGVPRHTRAADWPLLDDPGWRRFRRMP